MSKDKISFSFGPEMPLPEVAILVERLGFDGISVGDTPTNRRPNWDPLVALAQAATVTERILLSTSVLLLPLHHPVRLAKQIATLDVISGGRVILTVGIGGEHHKQYEAFGIPVSERGARANEYIEILRGLWTQPLFSYHGRFFQFEDITMEPKPVQKPHPPIWIGGRIGGVETGPDGKPRFKSKTGAIRRTARYGDGWLPNLMTAETYRSSVEQIKALAKKFGRDNHPITLAHNVFFVIRDSREEALRATEGIERQGVIREREVGRELSARYDIIGPIKDCIKRLEGYVDAGVTHFVCKTVIRTPQEIRQQMEIVAEKIIPYFR